MTAQNEKNKPSYEFDAERDVVQIFWSPQHDNIKSDQNSHSGGSYTQDSSWLGVVYENTI